MHFLTFSSRVLVLASLLSNAVANPSTSLDPRHKKRHDCIKPKVFIISMVNPIGEMIICEKHLNGLTRHIVSS